MTDTTNDITDHDLAERRAAIIEAAEAGLASIRQTNRVRYHLRRRDMRLVDQVGSPFYFAVCRTTTNAVFQSDDLDVMERWAKGEPGTA